MERETPLLPPELRLSIPKLYATENVDDPIVQAKLFTPWAGWIWFVTEFDGEDTCFGLVSGHEVELGYFSLGEISALEGPGGVRVERDLHFTPRPLSRVRAELDRLRGDPDGATVCENTDEFNAAADVAAPSPRPAGQLPSPIDQPGIRLIETRLNTTGLVDGLAAIATPRDAAMVLHHLVGDADREHFAALFLNSKHRITHAHVISRGTAQTTLVHPREVFKAAVLANAAAIVVGHNHPSGNVQPSPEDNAVNDRLERAGELLGIQVLDSLIVGPSDCFYAASTGDVQQFHASAAPALESSSTRSFETICRGLMQDIDEVLERQGKEWWDETVTAGTYHRDLAEKHLGLSPYRPLPDEAESRDAAEPVGPG